jgi:hypothetical protein
MRLPSFANPENLKVQDEPQPEPIPDDVSIPELAEQVARGKRKVSAQQMRMLVELLPYYSPKLTAIAVGTLNDQDFYARLERAIERSERVLNAKQIEAKAERIDD